MTEKEIQQHIDALVEQGRLVIIGYNATNEAMYATAEYAKENGIKPITN